MVFVFAASAQRIITFPFFRNGSMRYTIFTKTIEHPIDRHLIRGDRQLLFNHILA